MEIFAKLSYRNMQVKDALTVFEYILKRVIKNICIYNTVLKIDHNQTEKNKALNGNGYHNISSLKFGVKNCYLKMGNISDALNMINSVFKNGDFELEKEILMKSILFAYNAINWIVKCYSKLGDKEKVLLLHKELYETEKLIFSDNCWITIFIQYLYIWLMIFNQFQIVMLQSNLGDKKKALKFLEEIYEKQIDTLGENHELTMDTKSEIAKNIQT